MVGKNLLNSNISSTDPHNMVNFDPLVAEIDWRVWSTPRNFHRSSKYGELMEFCQVQHGFASKSCVFLYWQRYCTALEQWASAKLCGVQQWTLPIFGRAAITLGIGPHSSWMKFLTD